MRRGTAFSLAKERRFEGSNRRTMATIRLLRMGFLSTRPMVARGQ